MTIPKRISIKFEAEAAPGFDIAQAAPVFQRWIREHVIDDELLIDVTSYTHVVDGPGILLVGYEADYGLEMVDGRLGFRYTRKRAMGDSLTAAFHTLFAHSLHAARLLEAEPELAGLRVHTQAAEVAILDRLHCENSDEGVNAIGPALEDVLAAVYDGGATARRLANDPRQPLTVQIRAAGGASATGAPTRVRAFAPVA